MAGSCIQPRGYLCGEPRTSQLPALWLSGYFLTSCPASLASLSILPAPPPPSGPRPTSNAEKLRTETGGGARKARPAHTQAPPIALTKALPGPPVRLLDGGELDFRVQPEAVVEVGGAALGLSDDVEARKAAEAEVLPAGVRQVAPEGLAQGVEGGAEALGVEHVGVGQVRVGGVATRELLVPTGALAIWKKFIGDYRKHLQRKRKRGRDRRRREVSKNTSSPRRGHALSPATVSTCAVLFDKGKH